MTNFIGYSWQPHGPYRSYHLLINLFVVCLKHCTHGKQESIKPNQYYMLHVIRHIHLYVFTLCVFL